MKANGAAKVMPLYNAAVQAIRDVDPDRPILIGSPGLNDSEFLDPYVTDKYLTYAFNDGKQIASWSTTFAEPHGQPTFFRQRLLAVDAKLDKSRCPQDAVFKPLPSRETLGTASPDFETLRRSWADRGPFRQPNASREFVHAS